MHQIIDRRRREHGIGGRHERKDVEYEETVMIKLHDSHVKATKTRGKHACLSVTLVLPFPPLQLFRRPKHPCNTSHYNWSLVAMLMVGGDVSLVFSMQQ